jgi:hypothetical protein
MRPYTRTITIGALMTIIVVATALGGTSPWTIYILAAGWALTVADADTWRNRHRKLTEHHRTMTELTQSNWKPRILDENARNTGPHHHEQ